MAKPRRPFRIPRGSRARVPAEARTRFWLCIPERPGVYVAALGNVAKIGHGENIRSRAKSVISSYRAINQKKGAWRDRQLAAYITCDSKQEAMRLEKHLHGMLSRVWIERELFNITGADVIEFVRTAAPEIEVVDCYSLLDRIVSGVVKRH